MHPTSHQIGWDVKTQGAHLYGNGHERPAFVADVCTAAAGSHIVIVCQVYIKDQLPGNRKELPRACVGLTRS